MVLKYVIFYRCLTTWITTNSTADIHEDKPNLHILHITLDNSTLQREMKARIHTQGRQNQNSIVEDQKLIVQEDSSRIKRLAVAEKDDTFNFNLKFHSLIA